MSQPWQPQTPHDHAVMDVLLAVRAFSDAMDRMYGGMKDDMEMNSTDLAALRMLITREQRGDTVSPHQVAKHLRISTASTTKLIDRLAVAGHVERRPHPRDGRARIVVLTQASRREFFRHFGERLQTMRGVAERYDEEQLRVISRFLTEVGDVFDPK
ncbi:MarR family winged helix-turn-helix transcriptional regulator [Microbacterium sp.]|uniref:MarR family winged helix-turn-helix transcriptional regulator n=1 Tax=Microbacterium sp. TaxID=51671 RepID=UPI003F711667